MSAQAVLHFPVIFSVRTVRWSLVNDYMEDCYIGDYRLIVWDNGVNIGCVVWSGAEIAFEQRGISNQANARRIALGFVQDI